MCFCLVHVSDSVDRFYIYCFKNLFSSEKFIERTGGTSTAHQRYGSCCFLSLLIIYIIKLLSKFYCICMYVWLRKSYFVM